MARKMHKRNGINKVLLSSMIEIQKIKFITNKTDIFFLENWFEG